jgi:hypothetical protein
VTWTPARLWSGRPSIDSPKRMANLVIARTAGLVAHLADEAEHPIGMPL